MSETKKRYGYTGKGLRVNLTTGKFTVEPTFPRFNGLIGGTAFGYRVLWDEVPPDTDCYSPENKVVIAPGPLSGTGAICSGRTALTTLWPTSWPQSLIASAHVGGEIAHKMKTSSSLKAKPRSPATSTFTMITSNCAMRISCGTRAPSAPTR